MRLADELLGTAIRRPIKVAVSRRNVCLDDDVDRQEEKRRERRAKSAKWRRDNPDRVKAMRKRDAERHPERIKANKQRWRRENIAHVRAYNTQQMRFWRFNSPEKARAAKDRWYRKNRDAINAKRRARHAMKRAAR